MIEPERIIGDRLGAIILIVDLIAAVLLGLIYDPIGAVLLLLTIIAFLLSTTRITIRDVSALGIAGVGVATRWLFFGFTAYAAWSEIGATILFIVTMVLVASGEESFRAIIYELVDYATGNISAPKKPAFNPIAFIVSNLSWLGFHFVRRPFTPTPETLLYVAWLFVVGFILTVAYIRHGLGTAIFAHLLVNIMP